MKYGKNNGDVREKLRKILPVVDNRHLGLFHRLDWNRRQMPGDQHVERKEKSWVARSMAKLLNHGLHHVGRITQVLIDPLRVIKFHLDLTNHRVRNPQAGSKHPRRLRWEDMFLQQQEEQLSNCRGILPRFWHLGMEKLLFEQNCIWYYLFRCDVQHEFKCSEPIGILVM